MCLSHIILLSHAPHSSHNILLYQMVNSRSSKQQAFLQDTGSFPSKHRHFSMKWHTGQGGLCLILFSTVAHHMDRLAVHSLSSNFYHSFTLGFKIRLKDQCCDYKCAYKIGPCQVVCRLWEQISVIYLLSQITFIIFTPNSLFPHYILLTCRSKNKEVIVINIDTC